MTERYPTSKEMVDTLDRIKGWDVTPRGECQALLEYVRPLWGGEWIQSGRRYRLFGGVGTRLLSNALHRNTMFSALCYFDRDVDTYVFEVPKANYVEAEG